MSPIIITTISIFMEAGEGIFLPLEQIFSSSLVKKLSKLKKLSFPMRIVDLLLHLPLGYESIYDIATKEEVSLESYIGKKITLNLTINSSVNTQNPKNRFSKKKIYRIATSTDTGYDVEIVFFQIFATQVSRFTPGNRYSVTGKLSASDWGYQMVHPHIGEKLCIGPGVALVNREHATSMDVNLLPIYRLTKDLSQRQIRQAMLQAFNFLSKMGLPEWLSKETEHKYSFPTFLRALQDVHDNRATVQADGVSITLQRLILDELLASQMALQCARSRMTNLGGNVVDNPGALIQQCKLALGFQLTRSQEEVVQAIRQDQAKPQAMFRLLQGDVGSGKTVVALFAMLNAIESRKKAIFMVPTTILARQHYQWITGITAHMDINVAILTGAAGKKDRRLITDGLISGKIDILIGTHVLINDQILLHRFGIMVIDEQHRFGVHQRAALFNNSGDADILMMTATPIPRTLAMSQYGDIAVSVLSEKPANRQNIDTRIVSISRLDEMIAALHRALGDHEKIYWVCSCITESDNHDLTAVTVRYRYLCEHFGNTVGLLHGRMSEAERTEVIDKFVNSGIQLLVATTVVEIGIDVSDATIMIIEQAERFGLAQLHQLRGRVGRGHRKSYCFLLHSDHIAGYAKQRLCTIRESNDGFYIAEKDLIMRGAGSVLGIKQSGVHEFQLADPIRDKRLMMLAQTEARAVLAIDPDLKSARGQALKLLMKIFDYEDLKTLLRS